MRTIARCLNRSASSISREIRRNTVPTRKDQVDAAGRASFDATRAARGYRERRKRCVCRPPRLAVGGALYQYVHDRLIYNRWSPQRIAIRLKLLYPDDASKRMSHEPIYAAIYAYPRGGLKQALIEALRQEKPMRGRRRTSAAGAHFVPEALRIVHRPEVIEARLVPGHRKGGLTMDVRFADPHAPWQRSSNENTNGLLRQFLPKGMDLSTFTQTPIKRHRSTRERPSACRVRKLHTGRSHGPRNHRISPTCCT